jgi:hypothetical protein
MTPEAAGARGEQRTESFLVDLGHPGDPLSSAYSAHRHQYSGPARGAVCPVFSRSDRVVLCSVSCLLSGFPFWMFFLVVCFSLSKFLPFFLLYLYLIIKGIKGYVGCFVF